MWKMKQESLAKWLKGIIIGVFICGVILCFYVLPFWGKEVIEEGLELKHGFLPWLFLLWITALPCFAVLVLGWKVAGEIGADHSFSEKNAKYLKLVSILALADSAFIFAGSLFYLILGFSRLGILFLTCLVVFIGIAVSVAAALISHLVYKAARMQEENELTI